MILVKRWLGSGVRMDVEWIGETFWAGVKGVWIVYEASSWVLTKVIQRYTAKLIDYVLL